MRGRVKIVVVWILFTQVCFASDNSSFVDAKMAGMGMAGVSTASIHNSGGVSLLEESSVGVHYENLYNVKELSKVTAVGCWRNNLLDVGLVASRFGYEKYGEARFAAQVSKRIAKGASFGVRLSYYSYNMSVEEGRKSAISSDIGLLVSPVAKLQIGVAVENLVNTTYQTQRGEYSPPLSLLFGLSYQAAPDLVLISECEKAVDAPVLLKAGCQYSPLAALAFRVGVIGEPYKPTFGVGYRVSRFAFDVASVYHTVLGFYNVFSMQYKF